MKEAKISMQVSPNDPSCVVTNFKIFYKYISKIFTHVFYIFLIFHYSLFDHLILLFSIFKRHSMNNWNKGPDNGKSVSDQNQTYMMDTPMDPNHKNGEIRSRPQKWAGLGGGSKLSIFTIWHPSGGTKKTFLL